MKTLTRKTSLRRLIFALLSLLPIILIAFSCFRTGVVDIDTIDAQLSTFASWSIVADFYSWVTDTFFNGLSNVWLHCAICYFVWLMVVTCLDLFFGFFFAMLDMFRGFMDKLGGDL